MSTVISFVCILWGNIGVEKITERDFTQDCDCIAESVSPDPKTSSPESLNSGVGGPIKSSKNSDKTLLCTKESSSVAQSFFLVRKKKCVSNTQCLST